MAYITYPFICNDPETVAMQMYRMACVKIHSLVNKDDFHHFIEFHINLVDTLTELLLALLLVNRIFVTKLPLQVKQNLKEYISLMLSKLNFQCLRFTKRRNRLNADNYQGTIEFPKLNTFLYLTLFYSQLISH